MLDLKPIKSRECRATEAPWWSDFTRGAGAAVCRTETVRGGPNDLTIFSRGYCKPFCAVSSLQFFSDVDFVIEARTDIPNLISEVEELRTTLRACIARAGNPDAAEGCRQVIRTAQDALDGKEGG